MAGERRLSFTCRGADFCSERKGRLAALADRQARRSTMAEIAKEAGVSTTTVSKVLNELPGVGASTRVRIRQVIEQYDYVQNHAARNLRKRQSYLIDLVIMRLEGGYDVGIMHGIQDALEERGYRLGFFSTNESEASERLWLRRLLDQSTDGVLLLLPYEQIGLADTLMAQRIPFVAIGDRNEPTAAFPSIGSTIWLGGYTATEHLISLGHRRIGISTFPLRLTTSRARLALRRLLPARRRRPANSLFAGSAGSAHCDLRRERRAGGGRISGPLRAQHSSPGSDERDRLRRRYVYRPDVAPPDNHPPATGRNRQDGRQHVAPTHRRPAARVEPRGAFNFACG